MEINNDLYKIYVKAAKQELVLISVVVLIFNIFCFANKIYPLNYLFGTALLSNVLVLILFLIYKFDYKFVNNVIPIYLTLLEICIYPFALLWWKIEQVTPFLWFLLIPLGCVTFNIKRMVFYNILTFILVSSIFIISPLFNLNLNISTNLIIVSNIMTIIGCFVIAVALVWHYNKINTFIISNLYLADDIETEKLEEISADDKAKLKTLYLAIQEYFEKERPYCNSDFNVVYLANKLNTNVSYVSRAIKFGSQTNFNQFINQHRVNLVISMLNDGDLSHYTMLHIYTKAGFKYQSTFNSAFRKVMNMTPSEYIASKKIEN